MSATGIGAAVRRKEDQRFITGKGHYTDDVNRPGQAHAYFLRSPHAHAKIRKHRRQGGRRHAGRARGAHRRRACRRQDRQSHLRLDDHLQGRLADEDGAAPGDRPWQGEPCRRRGRGRRRRDAGAGEGRRREDQGRLRGAAGGGRSGQGAGQGRRRRSTRSRRATPSISGTSATRRRSTPRSRRPSTSPGSTSSTTAWCRMRSSRAPRSANTTPAPTASRSGTRRRIPHVARLVISAFVGMAPEHKLRVIAPDVGGGFGSKIFIYPEEVVCLWASRKIGRPVKWVSERSEAFLADAHGRDHVTHAEMAFDAEGKVTGLKVKTIANLGAYMSTFSSSVPTYLYGTLLSGQYEIPAIYCEVDAVYTNTVPVDAYRGAGRPEATFVVERLMEVGAREMGDRSRRSAQEELHQEFPAPDAGDHDLRRRRLSRVAQEGAGDRRLCGLRQAQARIRPPRQAARGRLLDLYRGLRDCAEPGGRLARLRRRLVGIGRGAGQSDRQCRSPHRLPPARPGPRDHLRAGRLRAARHPDRQRQRRARRHRQGAVRHGHLRLALGRGRHLGDRQGARQGRGQGQEGRRPPAGGGRRRHRVQGRQVHDRRHRQVGGLGRRRAQRLYRPQIRRPGARAGIEGGRVLRSHQLHLPGRLPHLRGRGRSADRRERDRRLDRGR